MTYIIGSIIIYLVLVLFFWSLCAVKNRSSVEESVSPLKSAEIGNSADEILVKSYSSAESV